MYPNYRNLVDNCAVLGRRITGRHIVPVLSEHKLTGRLRSHLHRFVVVLGVATAAFSGVAVIGIPAANAISASIHTTATVNMRTGPSTGYAEGPRHAAERR